MKTRATADCSLPTPALGDEFKSVWTAALGVNSTVFGDMTVHFAPAFWLNLLPLNSGFRRDVYDICGLIGYYAASCGNCLPTFREQRIGPILTGQESEWVSSLS